MTGSTRPVSSSRKYESPGRWPDLALSTISIVTIVVLLVLIGWAFAQIADNLVGLAIVASVVLGVSVGAWVWLRRKSKPPHERGSTREFRLSAKRKYQDEFKNKNVPTRIAGYLRIHAVHWLARQFRHAFVGKKLLPYQPGNPDFSVHDLGPTDEEIRVGVTGDFGSGIPLAGQVAEAMKSFGDDGPDLTIHLGDIYHTGSAREAELNFAPPKDATRGIQWPYGKRGALAIPGNHEYDSGGEGFYDVVLPKLHTTGIDDANTTIPQAASFFCLQNEHWLIVGLDTGYWATRPGPVKLLQKALGVIPGAKKKLPFLKRQRTRLPETVCAWLRDVVRPLAMENSNRGLIFLSHHQYITALDKRGDHIKPGEQIEAALGLNETRSVLWLQAHGHRLVTHDCQVNKDAPDAQHLEVYARTIGNGGALPDPIPDIKPKMAALMEEKLVRYVDNRVAAHLQPQVALAQVTVPKWLWPVGKLKPIPVGWHGYANLTFKEDSLTIEYHSLAGEQDILEHFLRGEPTDGLKMGHEILLTETFKVQNGNVVCTDETPTEPMAEGFLAPFGPPPARLPQAMAPQPAAD